MTGSGEQQGADNLIAAAFSDGIIKLFDPRLQPSAARVMLLREHHQQVLCIRAQSSGKMVSGCAGGSIKIWDLRKQASVVNVDTQQQFGLLDIHQSAPIFTGWSRNPQQVGVYSLLEGTLLNQIMPG